MTALNEKIKGFVASTTLASCIRVVEASDGTVAASGPYDQDVGITDEPALFASDTVSVRLATMSGTRKVTCASTCSIGDRLFPTTAGKYDTLAAAGIGTAGAAIGPGGVQALEACATAGGWVEVLPLWGKGGSTGGPLFVGTTDSAAKGTSSTAEQFFDVNTFTIPANFLKVGDVLRFKARVVMTATHTTDTFAAKLYLGAVAIAAPAAFDAADNDEILIQEDVIVTAIGATGSVKGYGVYNAGVLGTATARALSLAATSIDTTAAAIVRGSITVSVSDAGNAAKLRDLVVELVRQ